MFAQSGVYVDGIDIDPQIVDQLNSGQAHIFEPGLNELLQQAVKSQRFKAFTTPQPADVFVIAVPTPFMGEKQPDLQYVMAAAQAAAEVIEPGNLVILESTSPVGTTQQLAEMLSQIRPDLAVAGTASQKLASSEAAVVSIAYCPERVLPGKIIHELQNNDRIIGGLTPLCAQRASEVYASFVHGQCHETQACVAELVKLSENAFRDVNIAFANELSLVADELDVDVNAVIEFANLHPRVEILKPGPGVGGHCIAVDPWFIVSSSPERTPLIKAARQVNDSKPEWVAKRSIEMLVTQLSDQGTQTLGAETLGTAIPVTATPDAGVHDAADRDAAGLHTTVQSSVARRFVVSCLGLAYKPDIDDLRESPAVQVVKALAAHKDLEVRVVEPYIEKLPAELAALGLENHTIDQSLSEADLVVGLVAHSQFKALDPKSDFGNAQVFDAAGIWKISS